MGIVLTTSCKDIQDTRIEIEFNGNSLDLIEIIAGDSIEIVAKLLNENEKTRDSVFTWQFEGDPLDSILTPNGRSCLVKSGIKSGIIKIKVYLEADSTISDIIEIFIINKTLQSIDVISQPTITNYIEGQNFSDNGMIIMAQYEHFSIEATNYTIIPNRPLVPTDKYVTINYTEENITKTANIQISVISKTLQSITAHSDKTTFIDGEVLNHSNFIVIAQYEYLNEAISIFSLSKTGPLKLTDTEVVLSYEENGIKKETSIPITILPKTLQRIEMLTEPLKTNYIEGEFFDATGLSIVKHYEYLQSMASDWSHDKNGQLMPCDNIVKITCVENGIMKDIDIPIIVLPCELQEIEITTQPTRSSYIEGETFNSSGLVVTAHYEYKSKIVTNYNVDTNTKLTPSDRAILISYAENGIRKNAIIFINVVPKTLQNINIFTLPTKTSYIEGERFISNGLTIEAVYEHLSIIVTSYTIQATEILKLGDEIITISFTDSSITKAAMFNITIIRRTLQSLIITTKPKKLSYIEGELFCADGLVLTANYEYLSEIVTDYFFDKITPLMHVDNEVEFSFTFSGVTQHAALTIVVYEKTLQSITISHDPYTSAYIAGHYFDKAGLEITAHYEYMDLVVCNWTVDDTTQLVYGDTFIVVFYTENDVTKTVNVVIEIADNLLDHIEISSPASKLNYSSGEMLSTLGIVIRAYYTNGSSKIVGGFTTNLENPLTIKDTLVTISYTEYGRSTHVTKFATYSIFVMERILTGIVIITQPIKLLYIEGELFDDMGMVIRALYSDDTYQTIINCKLSINSPLVIATTEIIVYYTEGNLTMQEKINIEVTERILTGLEILNLPTKVDYKQTEMFDFTGLVVRAIYNNELYFKTITNYTTNKTNIPLTVDDEFIVITYVEKGIEKTANVPICVTSRTLTNIHISSPATKLEYYEGEYLDILGLTITATYSDAQDSIVMNWITDKTRALTLLDTIVTINYTEDLITKTTCYEITIMPIQIVDKQVSDVIVAIDSLPAIDMLTLQDKSALMYVAELYTALSAIQKNEVTNVGKLLELLDQIIKLESFVKPTIEDEYQIIYMIYNGMEFDDICFECEDYISIYKNSMGDIQLNIVYSAIAIEKGYEFVKWVDSNDIVVTYISNLQTDATYYAVFELTDMVNIVFHDYEDKEKMLLSLDNVVRSEFNLDGNDIANKIREINSTIPVAYYIKLDDGELAKILDSVFNTNFNATIYVYVVNANYRQVSITPENDFLLSYVYEYTDDNNQKNNVIKSYNKGTQFLIPINACVNITITNPLITDILLDGVSAGLVYPNIEYEFYLDSDEKTLNISFTHYAEESVSLVFTGINTSTYSYDKKGWNGKLSANDLNNISFVFDESNLHYLNRYIIDNQYYLFEDLTNYIFYETTTISVIHIQNKFDIIFAYSGGSYVIDYLIGRQTILNALSGFVLILEFIDNIFENLAVYNDSLRQTLIMKDELLSSVLLDNMTLYIQTRESWPLKVVDYNTEITLNIPTNDEYDLLDELPILSRTGYNFLGYSLAEDGNILSYEWIEVILANINIETTIYAVYKKREDYNPPPVVDYSNETFVGRWNATLYDDAGIIDSKITLSADGTYQYETLFNGELSVKLTGNYLYNLGELEILSLLMDGEYQLINISLLTLNIKWTDDNILIAPCFIKNDMSITSYLHYLTRNEIRPANYNGLSILGEHVMELKYEVNGSVTIQNTTLTFYPNGVLLLTMFTIFDDDEIYSTSETALFRITTNNEIWIISNTYLGTMNFTEVIYNLFVKSGQDYSQIVAGVFIPINDDSISYASLVEIHTDGSISLTDINGTIWTSKLNIVNASEYSCYLQMEMEYIIKIEVTNDNYMLVITLNGDKTLYYNKVN
ncbi:MAG: hypothetical protein LBF12_00230 [Christensenellaceae bacterium]|nr:hypothetical protein [Christensenellaceae bacterium]